MFPSVFHEVHIAAGLIPPCVLKIATFFIIVSDICCPCLSILYFKSIIYILSILPDREPETPSLYFSYVITIPSLLNRTQQ